MSAFKKIQFKTVVDMRGSLTVAQDELPFDVVRSYWIFGSDNQLRGGHRHYITRQLLVAIHGRIDVYMDDNQHREEITLDSASCGLLVEPEDWHTMFFHPGSILLVFASHKFDADDYIDEAYEKREL